jgi:hypothetical protein
MAQRGRCASAPQSTGAVLLVLVLATTAVELRAVPVESRPKGKDSRIARARHEVAAVVSVAQDLFRRAMFQPAMVALEQTLVKLEVLRNATRRRAQQREANATQALAHSLMGKCALELHQQEVCLLDPRPHPPASQLQ